MKKLSVTLCMLFASGILFAAKKNTGMMYDTGRGFIGAEVGLGGIGNFSVGVLGGYHYYFKESWQFAGMRHGVRGIAKAGWSNWSSGLWTGSSHNAFFITAGADWTIDFNPSSRYVWGAYVGLSFGYFNLFYNYRVDPFLISGNLGGSLTIDNTHKFELAAGNFSFLAFRYIFMF